MKKTYIIPESLTVQLGTCNLMAESLGINSDTSNPDNIIQSPSAILTKETSDVNLWDNEW